jgi:hypothetical protein
MGTESSFWSGASSRGEIKREASRKDSQMNRIYQGRVTKVEILNGKGADGEPQPLNNWPDALWLHHELFQDVTN